MKESDTFFGLGDPVIQKKNIESEAKSVTSIVARVFSIATSPRCLFVAVL